MDVLSRGKEILKLNYLELFNNYVKGRGVVVLPVYHDIV